MASCLKHIPTFLLFVLTLSASHLQVHARESKFFSKVTNHMSMNSKTRLPFLEHPLGVPAAAPDLAPAPALSPSAPGELAYSSRSNGIPSDWDTDPNDVDGFGGRISGEELVGGSFEGYGSGDTFPDNLNYDEEVNGRQAGGFSSIDEEETQQGMSDTRYMEKGRYFYHLKGESGYGNRFEPEVQTASDNSYTTDTMEEYYKKQDEGVYVP